LHLIVVEVIHIHIDVRIGFTLFAFFRSSVKDFIPASLMGNQNGSHEALPPRAPNKVDGVVRLQHVSTPRRPIPDETELERLFNEVLLQMDLPPERAKLLKSFDNSKKWEIICDREQVITIFMNSITRTKNLK